MRETSAPPPLTAFTPTERRLIRRLNTPERVQKYLNALDYNREEKPLGETLRSFRSVLRHQMAHCLEAALAAAVILEQHGFPPLVLSFESIDKLEHVIYVYRQNNGWGSIARSRDPGLHGRKAVFANARALAKSYFEPYVDHSGCITAYAVVNLRTALGSYDWRFSEKNMWKVEQMLIDYPHHALPVNWNWEKRLRARYTAFCARYPDRKPLRYSGREHWSDLPAEYTRRGYDVDWVEPNESSRATKENLE